MVRVISRRCLRILAGALGRGAVTGDSIGPAVGGAEVVRGAENEPAGPEGRVFDSWAPRQLSGRDCPPENLPEGRCFLEAELWPVSMRRPLFAPSNAPAV